MKTVRGTKKEGTGKSFRRFTDFNGFHLLLRRALEFLLRKIKRSGKPARDRFNQPPSGSINSLEKKKMEMIMWTKF